MADWKARTRLLLGDHAIDKLDRSTVAVLGLGGVGSACAEALCRAGVGRLILVDHDQVEESNLNRQLIATRQTLGQSKCQAARDRLCSINPKIQLILAEEFYLPDHSQFLYELHPDVILDAIDTVTAKLHLAKSCYSRGIPLVSCLGTGNRLDPSALRSGDLFETATNGVGCPLARVMRRELRKLQVPALHVVYSLEPPLRSVNAEDSPAGRHSPGSAAFVPPAAGFLLASEGIRLLLK